MLKLLLFICCVISNSLSNNIDIKVSPIIKNGSAASYFGYSVTGVSGESGGGPWVAVGSPKANSSKSSYNETGALFKCPVSMKQTDCEDISIFIKETETDRAELYPSRGWYGVSVDADFQDILVCGHRLSATYFSSSSPTAIFAMPGGCVVLAEDDLSVEVEKLDQTHKDNKRDFKGDRNNINVKISYERSRFGQMGISSVVEEIDADNKFSGVVGEQNWRGAFVSERGSKYLTTEEPYSYGGYSLAAGKFFDAGKKGMAVGAPRYNLTGAVLIFETLKQDKVDPTKILLGHYGSYFGMSICASDFDKDGLAEIAVGAPYYTELLGKPAIGKVFIYGSKNNFSAPLSELKAKPTEAQAFFGRCVAALGDVDHDDYNDLGVGAPYEGEGALYIYHGSSSGLSDIAVQIIRAAELPYQLKTVGWSIRGQVDLDDNGYPDIVVGAYASDAVMILRAVPVVNVTMAYHPSPRIIDVATRNCTVNTPDFGEIDTVCFVVDVTAHYEDRAGKMKDKIDLGFSLEADTMVKDRKRRRVRFKNTHTSSFKIDKVPVPNLKSAKVFNAEAYLRTDLCPECEDKIDPFPDIELMLTPVLPERDTSGPIPTSGSLPDLEKHFQLPFHTQAMDYQLRIKRDCNPCKPDLKIESDEKRKIPVKSQFVQLEIVISNKKQKAYGVRLKTEFPAPLKARLCGKLKSEKKDAKCLWEPDCEVLKNATELNCFLGTIGDKDKNYVIELATSQASSSLETYRVLMNVSSENEEEPELLTDNFKTVELTVESTADIRIDRFGGEDTFPYGGSVRGQYSMTNYDQIGLKVEHKYVVHNEGPDVIPEANFTIYWPYQATNGKHLLYLISLQEGPNMKCYPGPGVIDPLRSQFKSLPKQEVPVLKNPSNRTRRDVRDDEDADANKEPKVKPIQSGGTKSTAVLDCRNNTAMCVQIPCTAFDLEGGKESSLTIKSRIWNGTLLEDYTDRAVRVFSYARINNLTSYVADKNPNNHEAEMSSLFYPSTPKTTKKGIEVWIIIVSAIAGVVLLIILIVVFKMCGFFKRMDTERYDQVPEN